MKTFTLISGTNRPQSNTRTVAAHIADLYRAAGHTLHLLDLVDLPAELFTPGAYGAKPEGFKNDFIEPLLAAEGLHLVVPEYNGGFPGVLKYFIDMLPFPESFEARAVAFTGISAGASGALRPVEQLQMIFGYRNGYIYPRRVFIPSVHEVLDDSGKVVDEDLATRLQKQVDGFSEFVSRLKRPS